MTQRNNQKQHDSSSYLICYIENFFIFRAPYLLWVIFLKVGCLDGKRVITSHGKFLGEVEDTEISVDEWSVTHLHVNLEKEISEMLHFDNPFLGSVKVLLPVNTVDVVGDVIVLKKSLDELKEMKEFKPQIEK